MPIRVPNDLPARRTLESEGVMVMTEASAARQDIRPLRIGLLNLMPNKIKTETQFARLIGATPLQVELSLVKITSHTPKNADPEHMLAFYANWEDVKHEKFDGFIVTGAPVELLEFSDVNYWDELSRIYDWTQTHVHSTFNICWGAQAALWHFHKVPKHALPKKRFGVYTHRNLKPNSPYLRGFSDDFSIPVSRWRSRSSTLARWARRTVAPSGATKRPVSVRSPAGSSSSEPVPSTPYAARYACSVPGPPNVACV